MDAFEEYCDTIFPNTNMPKPNEKSPITIPAIDNFFPPRFLSFLILLNAIKPKITARVKIIQPKNGIQPRITDNMPNTKEAMANPEVAPLFNSYHRFFKHNIFL